MLGKEDVVMMMRKKLVFRRNSVLFFLVFATKKRMIRFWSEKIEKLDFFLEKFFSRIQHFQREILQTGTSILVKISKK